MRVRFAVFAALAAFTILVFTPLVPAQVAAPAPSAAARVAAPPPMFSPSYVEALRDILRLEQPDVARLEQKLNANPEDFRSRLKVMAYYQRADRAGHSRDLAKRLHHTLWLIEHHPDSEILHSFVSHFSPGALRAAEYRRATALWAAASKAKPRDAAVQWNAASFFEGLDAGLYMRYLEATAAADPNHPFALRPLADLYALSILEGGPLASRAQTGLDASGNVWVLGNAAYMLQSQYNLTVQRARPNPRIAALAERYFLRAKELNPALDRNAILPQLGPEDQARAGQIAKAHEKQFQAKFEKAAGTIRRLPVSAFPALPPAVAASLRARKCTVPQPAAEGPAVNVIHGQFFARGETGWAVLCSVRNSSSVLVFRNDGDTKPDRLATMEDKAYLQGAGGDKIVYSRKISAVSRDFIIGHYRAYGGPQPPPIDHQGIDDAFLEKASITWYYHNGKWMQLQGAD